MLTPLLAHEESHGAGEMLLERDPIPRDFYGAAATIHISGAVTGDLVLAGQHVTVEGPVSEDVIVAGEIVTLIGNVGDDVRAAGRVVRLTAEVGDHMVAAGERVTLSPEAKIGSWAWLAGAQVEVLGQIGQQLKAAGQEVIIAGEIGGDVEIMAEEVRILDTAVIHGSLTVRSQDKPEIAAGARILGEITHAPIPEIIEPAPVVGAVLLVGVVYLLGLILTGIVYFLMFPQFSVTTARHIEQVPLASLGLGFLVLIVGPVVIVLLFSLGVGFLLGIVLAAAYLIMLIAGGLTGVIYISDVAQRRLFKKDTVGKGRMVLSILGAFVVLLLVQLIPFIGSLATFLLTVMGIGALKYQFMKQYQA
jgi:cytoskeletal protein CcmA (bactofilin family)